MDNKNGIEVILLKEIDLKKDGIYIEIFCSYKNVNEIWNKTNLRKVVLIPGYGRNKSSEVKKGFIFETIVLYELKQYYKNKEIKCEYIGKRTNIHGFDIVLLLNNEEIWFVECKYNTNSLKKAFDDSIKNFSGSSIEFKDSEHSEIESIIQNFKTLDIDNMKRKSNEQRKKIINALSNLNSWKDIENFVSGIGSKNKKELNEEWLKKINTKNLKIIILFLTIDDDILNEIIDKLENSLKNDS